MESSERARVEWMGVALLLALMAALSVCVVRSFDAPWVVAAGREVLRTGGLPARDPFSYTASVPWMHHEWLTEVLCAALFRAGGWSALCVLDGVMVALAVALVLGRPRLDLSLWVAALLALGLREGADPLAQLFSNVLFAATLRLLLGARDRSATAPSPRLALPLLAIQLLWTQLHGGNPTGVALLGAWLLSAPSWRRLALLVSSALLTCAGPYGWRVHEHFFAHREAFAAVREFQPLSAALSAGSGAHFGFVALVLIAAVALLVRARRGERVRFEVIAMALLFAITVVHVRLATETAMVAAAAIVPLLSSQRARPVLALAGACALLLGGASLSSRRLGVGLDRDRFPIAAMAYLAAANPPGPMFNSYNLGGYLLFARPSEPVFIDGRAFTIYSDSQVRELAALYDDPPRFAELERRYRFRLAVLQRHGRGAALLAWLAQSGRWRTAYQDRVAVVLVRDAP